MANVKISNHFKILFGFLLLSISKADQGFPLKKCSKTDEQCLNSLFQDVIDHIAKDGAPEFGIPDTDPYEIKDITFTFLDSINITITEGVVEGLKTCVYEKNQPYVDKLMTKQIMTCDTKIDCKFVVTGANSFIQSLLGTDTINGKGNLVASLDKIRIDMDLPFTVEERDGKTYLNYLEQEPNFEFTVENVEFNSSEVIIANQDFSAFINAYFKQNWKMLLQSFGKSLVRAFLDIYLYVAHKFFMAHSTDQFILEDLSSYVTKN